MKSIFRTGDAFFFNNLTANKTLNKVNPYCKQTKVSYFKNSSKNMYHEKKEYQKFIVKQKINF